MKNKLLERLHGFACSAIELTKPAVSVGVLSLDMHEIIASALRCGCNKELLVCETNAYGKKECQLVHYRRERNDDN